MLSGHLSSFRELLLGYQNWLSHLQYALGLFLERAITITFMSVTDHSPPSGQEENSMSCRMLALFLFF